MLQGLREEGGRRQGRMGVLNVLLNLMVNASHHCLGLCLLSREALWVQLFSEILFSVPLRVGDIFLSCVSWPIYNMCFKNMPGLTIQCLLKTWKHEWKRVWKLTKHASLMYSFSIKSHTKISTSLVPDSRVKVKATELRFHFSIGSMCQEAKMRSFWRGTSWGSAQTCLCLHWQTPLYVIALIGGGDIPLKQWKRHSFNIRNTGQHELSTQTVLRAMCLSCMSPRCWGGVYWWHCLPFHILNPSDPSAPCPLEPYSLLIWPNNLFHAEKNQRTWLERSYFSGCVTCFGENVSI